MHLTLHFIGDVDEAGFAAVKSALMGVAASPFEIHLEAMGQFPVKGKPRVLWVGLKAPSALFTLHQSILALLTLLGLPPPDHPFSPHITLARFKNPPLSETVRPYFDQHAAFKTELFAVSSFILFSSTLTPHGSIYHREAVYPLSAPHDT